MSAVGKFILELIDLSLDVICKLSEFSLTSFSLRVEVEESRILRGSKLINSFVCISLEIGNFCGEISSHGSLRNGSLFLSSVDKVIASVNQEETKVIDVVIKLGK